MKGPLKWFGGKSYLATRIVALMPRHLHYCEPFAGGLSVLLARDPTDKNLWLGEGSSFRGVSEVVNDLNGELSNFWTVLQSPDLFRAFQRFIECVPLSRVEFEAAQEPLDPDSDYASYGGVLVVRAARFFIRCRQSRAGSFAGLRH